MGIDQRGTDSRPAGAIRLCFESNPHCALRRMYPDSQFQLSGQETKPGTIDWRVVDVSN